jgi:predicted dehydrogenase
MSARRCRVAFIGAGSMGREHAKAFRSLPDVELVGIFSRTRSRAEELAREWSIGTVCDSIEALAHDTGADLVIISVPELEVRAVVAEAVRYPWALLIEKPAGYDVPDAEQICDAVREQGRIAMVALNRRWYSSTRAALEDLASVSSQRFIQVLDQQDQQAALAMGQPPLVVANYMYANSIHLIDYLRVFGRGAVTEVQRVVPWDPAKPGIVVSKIAFESGDIALYEGIWNGPGPWAVTVSTPARRWEMRPLERCAVQVAGSRQLEARAVDQLDVDFKPGLVLQARHAVSAAMGDSVSLPTVFDALETMRLARAIFTPLAPSR